MNDFSISKILQNAIPSRSNPARYRSFAFAMAASVLLWLSFPPVGLAWLAWLALIPLVWLVGAPALPGQTPYREIGLAGFLYWLATFYFIPIPHWALWFGWVAVALYMAIYTPLFVGISRTLVHRYRVPVWVAAPIVWTGLEWIRCNFITGMAMVCLSHTQFKHPLLIQVADLSGAYTLTFAMMMFAAGVAVATRGGRVAGLLAVTVTEQAGRLIAVPSTEKQTDRASTGDSVSGNPSTIARINAIGVALLALASVMGYGLFRLNEPVEKSERSIQIALIQSSIDVVFKPKTMIEKQAEFEHFQDLTLSARMKWPDLDLIVWPESSFPTADLLSDFDSEMTVARFAEGIAGSWASAIGFPAIHSTPVPLLTGSVTADPQRDETFNSAILILAPGIVSERYFKIHRVMFGEYIPIVEWFPGLEILSPIGRGLTAGTQFQTFEVSGVKIAPSVCFETTIPHLIRRMVNDLEYDQHAEPDVLINLTNDGWFYGTSCLDLHLACNVFRAVEMRKPHLVCANTGFSAEIDSNGRLLQVGPRRDVGMIRADVSPVVRSSLYRVIGDAIPMIFGSLCVVTFLVSRRSGTSVR